MTFEEFDRGIEKLKNVYGDRNYSDPRVRLIYAEVGALKGSWWLKTVDNLITSCRQYPLLPEFREMIAIERERHWKHEKEVHAKEAKEWAATYPIEDIKTICGEITKRLKGGMNDADFDNFKKMITPLEIFRCARCEDTGFYWDRDNSNAWMCDPCQKGKKGK